jgi:hypothetical protein
MFILFLIQHQNFQHVLVLVGRQYHAIGRRSARRV